MNLPEDVITLEGFSGLSDTLPPHKIRVNEAAETQNCLTSDGVLSKIKGTVKVSVLPSGRPIRSKYSFMKPAGLELLLVADDNGNLYKSPNGLDWTLVVSGLNVNFVMGFAIYRGSCYMCNGFDDFLRIRGSDEFLINYSKATSGTADGGTTTTLVDAVLTQANGYWNGLPIEVTDITDGKKYTVVITDFDATTDTLHFGALPITVAVGDTYIINGNKPPKGSILEVHNEKLFVSDLADKGVIRWNDENLGAEEFNSWTYLGKVAEVEVDDGDRITALKSFGGLLVIFKKFKGFWLFRGWIDTFDSGTNLIKGSDEIGCIFKGALVEKDERLVWIALHGIYAMDRSFRPQRISDNKVEKVFERIDRSGRFGFGFNYSSWLQTLKEDFFAGIKSNGITIDRVSGDIRHGWRQTTTADFNAGTFENINIADNEIKQETFRRNFLHRDTVERVINPHEVWIELGSTPLLTIQKGQTDVHVSVDALRYGDDRTVRIRLDLENEAGVRLLIFNRVVWKGWRPYAFSFNLKNAGLGVGTKFRIRRFHWNERVRRWPRRDHYAWVRSRNFLVEWPGHHPEATYTSQVYDTGFASPLWGTFRVTIDKGDALFYKLFIETRVSADNIAWDEWVSIIPSHIHIIASLAKRFVQWRVRFLRGSATKIKDVTITHEDWLLSQVKDTGIANPIWDIFSANVNINNQEIEFEMWVSSDGTTWLEVDKHPVFSGEFPINAPKRWVRWKVILRTPHSLSGEPVVKSVTINWAASTITTISIINSIVFNHKAYFTMTVKGSLHNDMILMLDEKNDWQKIRGVNAGALVKFKTQLWAGASNNGDIFRMYQGRNFREVPIDAFWKTGKLGGRHPTRVKEYRDIYLICNRVAGSTLQLGYSTNGEDFKDIAVLLDGEGVINKRLRLSMGVRGKDIRLRFRNNELNESFEIIGAKIHSLVLPEEVTFVKQAR